jgi:L-ascorbate metabolism protein UlaG (beta-lactamase superfamily)
MIPYSVIASGSRGNAVTVGEQIMIDCGVPFKALGGVYKGLKLVLLTHGHSDHFNIATIRRLAAERPTLRFGCGHWLTEAVVDAGVDKANIDVLRPDTMYLYGVCNIIPVLLYHNAPNCGYKLHFPAGKVFYATDTASLKGIQARHYDLYLVEANHVEAEIEEKIRAKKGACEYAYEIQAAQNHLSKEQADAFIYANAGPKSTYAYLHCHREKGETV